MSTSATKVIVPIKLDISFPVNTHLIDKVTKYFFNFHLPKKYRAISTTVLDNNPTKTKQEDPLNKALRNIKDLEWNYAVVIETRKKDEDFVVEFMRTIFVQFYNTPFNIDDAILQLKHLSEEGISTVACLTKVPLTNQSLPTTIYYYPNKKQVTSLCMQKRFTSLNKDCMERIASKLSLKDYRSLTQACKSVNDKIATLLTSNLLEGTLKEDLLHEILSHDDPTLLEPALLEQFIHLLKGADLASLIDKYWNALNYWTYLFKQKHIDQAFIYKHYPLGKALFGCIIGYGYNTKTKLYTLGYNKLYESRKPLKPAPLTKYDFRLLENKLANFITEADLRINDFPYNYNMIDAVTTTVYCKDLPINEFTVGLSYYDIVVKGIYYYKNDIQPFLSKKMLKFLFERGLSYLPAPTCKSSQLKLRYPYSTNSTKPYNSETLESLLNTDFINVDDLVESILLISVLPNTEQKPPTIVDLFFTIDDTDNIFNNIYIHNVDLYPLQEIARFTDAANRRLDP
jgi:hypothetical protein